VDVGVLNGVASTHHHAVSEVDADMTFSGGIIRSLEENKVTGFCFGLADVLTLVPQTIGSRSAHVVAVLVVHPADVTAAIETGIRGTAAPYIGRTDILLGLSVDFGKFLVRQCFRRNRVVDASFTGTIRTASGQTIFEQVRPATLGVLEDFIPLPLIFC